nr:phage holin family protein [uncultured Agathobaculum sp.]
MEQLTQYIQADYAILAAVLFCLGRALKAVKRFPNQFIPLALTGCGVVLACLSAGSRYGDFDNWAAALFEGLVQGILCTGVAVSLNEMLAHRGRGGGTSGEDEDKKE